MKLWEINIQRRILHQTADNTCHYCLHDLMCKHIYKACVMMFHTVVRQETEIVRQGTTLCPPLSEGLQE